MKAVLLAGDKAVVAYERLNTSTGLLRVLSVTDGRELQKLPLDTIPLYDGLVAAGGRLYLATRNGIDVSP